MHQQDDPFAAAKANLYSGALQHIADWKPGRLEKRSYVPWSSQALCISVWGTLDGHPSQDAVLGEISAAAGVDIDLTSAKIECEVRTLHELLNEVGGGTPTSRDVVITAPSAVMVVESKFTEPLSVCSQPRTSMPDLTDANGQPAHNCSGNLVQGSDQKTGTAAPCRLTVWDGRRRPRRYWDIAAGLFNPGALDPPQIPCPFRDSNYQLMRNLCFAAAFAQRDHLPGFGLIIANVARAKNSAKTAEEVAAFQELLRPEVAGRVGSITYERIADILQAHDPDFSDAITMRIDSAIPV
jgi:hypothetical protein